MLNFKKANFGGADYEPERDMERMSNAMASVYRVMSKDPHRWWSLQELSLASKVPQSSVGSYLCYLRRDFNYTVPKKYIDKGLYKYKLGEKLSDQEIEGRKIKKMKPIGDKKLFGEMMRSIHAYAHSSDLVDFADMQSAMVRWRDDYINKIRGSMRQ